MENTFDSNKNSRILMIDDDLKLCRLVKDYLEPLGFAVEAALRRESRHRKSDAQLILKPLFWM